MKNIINKFSLIAIFVLFSISTIFAQQISIKGIVKDNQGQPLPGATVQVKGTTLGTITDANGNFLLSSKNNETIIISCIGYESQEIKAEAGKIYKITLNEDTKKLNEVVVVGFGTQKKVNLTGAVGVIDSKSLESRPVQNVTQALQGLIGGLNISNESGGGLGANPTVNIRGIGTIGQGSSGNPLILVDGVEVNLSTVNPQDVESVSVLKDAAASSIYGSRAPFGVILITTKKGKKGEAEVTYNNNFRYSSAVSTPRMADSYSFVQSFNAASRNAGWGDFFNPDMVSRVYQYVHGEIKTTTIPVPGNPKIWDTGYFNGNDNINYYDVIYRKNAPSQEHNLSISGGSDNISYYISANYLQQSGILNYGNDHSERYTTNAKIDATLNKYLKIHYNARFTRNDLSQPVHLGGMFYQDLARQIWPTKPLYDNNGILFDDHILGLQNGGKENQQINTLLQNVQMILEPIKGWHIVGDVNYRISSQFHHWDYKTYYQTAVDGISHGNEWRYSTVQEQAYNNNYYNLDLHSDYEKSFSNGHYFKIMGGVQSEGNKYRDLYVSRDGIIDPTIPTINTTTGLGLDGKVSIPNVSGAYNDWAVVGFFGRLNYNYKERYLFEANLRYDGSSRFRANNRWGIFPSFSAGWNVSKEDFFKPLINTVNNLKFRASYGSLGNQNTDNLYPTYEIMGLGRSNGTWLLNGTRPSYSWMPSLIDQSLTWEKIKSWNFGVDLSLLNNRLTSSFDYYTRYTEDMVGPAEEVPAILGIAVSSSNNTDLKTWGFEFELSWRDKLACGLNYGAKFLLSDSKTQITRYPNPTNTLTQYRTGQMLGEIWGYTTKGIAKTDEEMQNHLSTLSNGGQDMMGSDWKAGDIMYVDVDKNGRIDWGDNTSKNPGDVHIIGNSTPRFSYGFDLSADYKGIDIRIFLQGVMKRDFFQNSYYFWGINGNQGPWFSTLFVEHKDYFRNDPNDPLGVNLNAYYPRALFGTAKNQQVQTRYLQDAAYLRLKNLQIGYTIQQKLTQKIALNKVRFYLSGENLLTLTKLSTIFDPETIGGGWGGSVYPLSKVFSFGMSVTL
jgi:TonB-linked SusC/RagA family outer membrane protein